MDYRLLTDELLVKLLRTGDADAFKEIYTRYWKNLYNTALAKVRVQTVAEELLQNIFISVWERRNVLEIAQLEHYLNRALKYGIINYIKGYLVKEKHLHLIAATTLQEENASETQLLLHELSAAIHNAIEQLPQKTQVIFKLSRQENRTTKEISAIMHLSEKAVEYHITQSLRLMRLHLKDFIIVEALLFVFFS